MHEENGRTRIGYDQHCYCSGYHYGLCCSSSHDKLQNSIDVSMINAGQEKSYTVDGKINEKGKAAVKGVLMKTGSSKSMVTVPSK